MSSSQGTRGSVVSTMLVLCRLCHAASANSIVPMEEVISLDSMDLLKLCDVIFKDRGIVICRLDYSKPEGPQLTTTKPGNVF